MLILAFSLCYSELKAESKFCLSYFSIEDPCTKRLQISRELFLPENLGWVVGF